MLTHSEEINEIATALAAAGPELKNPKKDKEVNTGSYTYKYAQLDTILEAVKPVLSKNGIAIIQDAANIPNGIKITTMLLHKTGQWFASELEMPTAGGRATGAQAVGSAITYGRRYSLTALLGIAAEDDDDGAGATPANGQKPAPKAQPPRAAAPAAKPPATPPKFVPVSKEQGERLTAAATAIGYDKKKLGDFIKGQFKITGPEEFSSAMCDKVIEAFEKKGKEVAAKKAAAKPAAKEEIKVEEEPAQQEPYPWDGGEGGEEITPAMVDAANEAPVETPEQKQQRIDANIEKAGAK